MKKTISLFAFLPLFLSAQQVTVQDDARVGNIITGSGNTINTTQIFGKSPEYAELKKSLETLEADIQKKAAVCEKMAKDNLPAEYRDGCRSELIALNARRDSVQKIETRFREDVIRLAESFSKMELNSRRLFLADSLFREGKIREAETLLNFKEITQEGDALLAKKDRQVAVLQETDSLLYIKSDELILKARLKVTDYTDSLRYDSAQMYFEQSRRYAETVENLEYFAYLLKKDNQTHLAVNYYEKALQLARSEYEEAGLALTLGICYSKIQKMTESEKMYLRSLEIYERLAKSTEFRLDFAKTCYNLGTFYSDNDRQKEAIHILKKGVVLWQKLAEANPALFTKSLAMTFNNLGFAYLKDGDFSNARECLEKSQALKSDNSWVFRNWACFFALQNEVEKSVENLQKSAALGYDDPDWVRREKSLDMIRGHSAFPTILNEIEQNREKKRNYKE